MNKDKALKLALEALELAQDNLRNHGDNCFLHDEGEYNRCFCGKDSLSDHLQSVVEKLDEALAQPEPMRLRRGDILRCIETDKLCTVWSTSTTGKTLIKWGANDFGGYTAEQIGELFWLEPSPDDLELAAEKSDNYAAFHAGYRFAVAHPLAQPEPWEKFCDSSCVWTDHHPDCKLAEQEQFEIDWPEYNSFAMGCGLEDRGITSRYEAMQYGWDEAIERVAECLPEALYTTPPQRKPLTDEEIDELRSGYQSGRIGSFVSLARAIEAKLKEKNT